jgi:Flp pilus assembly pilin Flp
MTFQSSMVKEFHRFAEDTQGATIIEYAFIISLISIAIGFIIPDISSLIDTLFSLTSSGIGNAAAGASAP